LGFVPRVGRSVVTTRPWQTRGGILGFVPRVGRSVVTTRPWQTRVGILGYEFGA
jgi:hypothetical protein